MQAPKNQLGCLMCQSLDGHRVAACGVSELIISLAPVNLRQIKQIKLKTQKPSPAAYDAG